MTDANSIVDASSMILVRDDDDVWDDDAIWYDSGLRLVIKNIADELDNTQCKLDKALIDDTLCIVESSGGYSFEGKEPDTINRNWLMHGMCFREITKLDCIKCFRILFALYLIEYRT